MRIVRFALIAGVVALAPTLALANGFALFEHGSRAVGMAGAFGAVADDPSAGYFNPAGLAFLDGTQAMAGFFLITESSTFTGDNPYPGAGYSVDMESQIFYPPHFHLTGHFSDNVSWGLSLTTPFGLGTWWPDDYAGKYITKRVDLKLFNLNPNLAFKLSDNVALAIGFDAFFSSVDLTRSIGAVNPYTQQVAEVGQVHLYTPFESGYGYNAALLAKLGGGFSLGAQYRSRVKVEYSGNASFVQFPTGYDDFDAIVAGLLPFDSNPAGLTEVTFPAELRFGLAWQSETWTFAADAVRMGWDSFDELPITLPDYPLLSSVRPENYEDATTYRFGVEKRWEKTALQLGYLVDPTPVPTESVSPLLPDADRVGYSVGFSYILSPRVRVDAAYLYLPFDERSTEGLDPEGFNGTYDTKAHLFGMSMTVRF